MMLPGNVNAPSDATCWFHCSFHGDDAYVTSYQRDIGKAKARRGCTSDDVGQRRSYRGKKMFHMNRGGHTARKPAGLGGAVSENNTQMNQSVVAQTGHLPGYTGHIPQSREHHFRPGEDARARNHQKDFFLLPDNFREHMVGYTGNKRGSKECYRHQMPL